MWKRSFKEEIQKNAVAWQKPLAIAAGLAGASILGGLFGGALLKKRTDISDVEAELNAYIPPEIRLKIKKQIAKDKAKSIIVKKPYLYGVSSFGLLPIAKREKILERAGRQAMDLSPEVRQLASQARQRREMVNAVTRQIKQYDF